MLDKSEKQLRRKTGEVVQLPPKAFDLLTFLVENQGRLLEKNELMDRVWADSFVEEGNLKINIHTLRKALDQDGGEFIETVPKRGYRFNADVRAVGGDLIVEKITKSKIVLEGTETASDDAKPGILTGTWRKWLFIPAAVGAAAVAIAGYLFLRPASDLSGSKPTTIAVLPLKNLSQSETDDFLSIGLTDSLITRLSNTHGLVARPISAVSAFTDATEAGSKLKVEAVLDGSIQREGEKLRISMKLTKSADGTVLWAEEFNENDTSLFGLQNRVSERVANVLQVKVSDQDRAEAGRSQTDDFEAYKLYLRGRYAWNKRTKEGLQASIKLFEQAIDRDPAFARGFAGLADSYALLSEYNVAPPNETFPKAQAAAKRALEIAPNLTEAHTTLAYSLASYSWNFAEAEREYRRAIELNPNYATARQWYGELLMGLKRFGEAEREYRIAAELDPLSHIIQFDLALLAYIRHDYDAAIAQYQKMIRESPGFPLAYAGIILAYEKQGRFDEAAEANVKLLEFSGLSEPAAAAMGEIHKKHGYPALLRALLAGAEREAQKGYVPAYVPAFLYARLGDRENTLLWAEKAYSERHRYIAYIGVEPSFDFLRDDPRFQDLIKRVGL